MMESETSDSGRFTELLAVAVAAGQTIRAAAESCGCSERQGYRVAASPEFKSRVSEIRSEMTNAAVGELSAAASVAVATIRELLNAENEPSVRLNAAKAILTQLGPMTELGELRQRLEALESKP
jgi:HEAT repeat protein